MTDSNDSRVHGVFISGKTYITHDGGRTWELAPIQTAETSTTSWTLIPNSNREQELTEQLTALRAELETANVRAVNAERERDAAIMLLKVLQGVVLPRPEWATKSYEEQLQEARDEMAARKPPTSP